MYWTFALKLLIASLVMPYAYAFLSLPNLGIGLLLVGSSPEGQRKIPLLLWPFYLFGIVWTFLIFCLWAAYCAWVTIQTVVHPSVTNDWLYYVTAFFLLIGPIQYMKSKEQAAARGSVALGWGTTWYPLLTVSVAFAIFCIWPTVMSPAEYILTRLPGAGGAAEQRPETKVFLGQAAQGDTIEILREKFRLDQAVKLLSLGSTRAQMRGVLAKESFRPIGTASQGDIVVDAYAWGTPEQVVQFLYAKDGTPVGVLFVVTAGLEDEAQALADNALDSAEAEVPPPFERGTGYFLGDHRVSPTKTVKIILRKDTVRGDEVYSVLYVLSAE